MAPDEKNPSYESNISKSFHLEECEGLVLYQFATKYPANEDQSRDEKAEILMLIDKENEKLSSEIELIDLNLDCG